MPTNTAAELVIESADWLRALMQAGGFSPTAKFDSRPTWANNTPKFDNRPTWDNWNKKK